MAKKDFDRIANWRGNVSGWGVLMFWQCNGNDARQATAEKAEWEGERFSFREATAEEVAAHEKEHRRWGGYDVGKREPVARP